MTGVFPLVSVVIATRNRKDHLVRALRSCLAQDYPAVEVMVYDDASSDDTPAAVRTEFPGVRYVRTEDNAGYIVLRNRGLREAEGKYVFTLDDDAYYTDPRTVSATVELLEAADRVAAVAIPFVEPRNPGGAGRRACRAEQPLRGFVGCAHALRREVAIRIGGYREIFFHQGEERDLCLRLYDQGFETIYGTGGPVVHTYSPVRDQPRLSYYGVRNTLLFDYLNVPHPYLLPALARHAVQLFFYKLRPATVITRLRYVVSGLLACVKYAGHRRPVARSTYRRFRSLPSHGPAALPEMDRLHTAGAERAAEHAATAEAAG